MKTLYSYTSSMPVSAKFYSRICDRVRSVIVALNLPDSDRLVRDTLSLINSYLLSSPEENVDTLCHIIFLTLKAEIDAAIERSRRARARAALRRALATPALSSDTSDNSDRSDFSDWSDLSDLSELSEKSDRSELSEKSEKTSTSSHPAPPRSDRHRYGFKFRPVSRPTRTPHPYPRKTLAYRR